MRFEDGRTKRISSKVEVRLNIVIVKYDIIATALSLTDHQLERCQCDQWTELLSDANDSDQYNGLFSRRLDLDLEASNAQEALLMVNGRRE